jgi:transcriptional regulator of arginine metabolism
MKANRHSVILDLINKYDIETQEDLAIRLREHDIIVTQATVSRDIKDLRLIKVLSENGVYKYATVEKADDGLKERFINIFAHSVVSFANAGNLVIVKTISGTANAAAEAIDSLKWVEIAGTIAGENTIFIAVKDQADIPELMRRFENLRNRR